MHPYKLTRAFIDESKRIAGTEVVIGRVEGVERAGEHITGVKVDGKIIAADVVVIAMGPWTHKACDWFDMPRISGGRAHSVVLRPKQPSDVTAHCLFTEYVDKDLNGEPELYTRPDGTVYACGFSDKEKLPNTAHDVQVNAKSCQLLKQICGRISKNLADAEVVAEQACYLPTPPGHLPVIGRVPNTDNVYMASGHTCWGILNAPATGKAVAELIVDGKCSFIDLEPFMPKNNM